MNHLSLFLEGDAFFLVLSRRSEENKKKPDAVRARLQEAFEVSQSQAYALFTWTALEWMCHLMRV